MDAENTAVLPFEQRFRTCFGNMLVCKTPANAKLFAELNLPSFIRDWLIMRFSDIWSHHFIANRWEKQWKQ